jgi:hypothetical protein
MKMQKRAAQAVVWLAWIAAFCSFVFGVIHAGDGDPLQFPAGMAVVCCLVFAVFATVFYAFVLEAFREWERDKGSPLP